jgi:DNA-binding NarL/FixJ family response regulator
MHDEGHFAIRALRSGAHGYIMKQEAAENVVSAVRTVLAGDVYVSEALRRTLDERAAGTAPGAAEGAISRLSDRELQVFQLIGNGWNMRRIADELHVSINTVETHRAHIRRKLNIRTTPDLLRRAVRWVESVRPR